MPHSCVVCKDAAFDFRSVRYCKLFLNYVSTCLREGRLSLDAQSARIVKQLVHTLVRNLAIQQFAHSRLGFPQNHLQILLRILSSIMLSRVMCVGL